MLRTHSSLAALTALALTALALAALAACSRPSEPATPPSPASGLATASIVSPTAAPALNAPLTLAVPADEFELGAEPDDAPHVDRALRVVMPRQGDRVIGRGFVLEGVPDDVTLYWPDGDGPEQVYLVYDAAHDHVATVREGPAPLPGTAEFDPAAVRWAPTARFEVWPSSFADGQTRHGAGRRAAFSGPRYAYVVETLGELDWLLSGWHARADP